MFTFSFLYFTTKRDAYLFSCTHIAESEWLKWRHEVGIFEKTSTATSDPQVTSKWNVSFSVVTDDEQTQIASTTMKWNTTFSDIVTGRLSSELCLFTAGFIVCSKH